MRLLKSDNFEAEAKRTEQRNAQPFRVGVPAPEHRATIYFDAACGMCSAGAMRMQRVLGKRGFTLAPLQDEGVAGIFGFDPGTVPDDMKLLAADGRKYSGADAFVFISRYVWWAWPFWLLSLIPGMKHVLRFGYRQIASRRQKISGACRLDF